jgi:hypothetical protein
MMWLRMVRSPSLLLTSALLSLSTVAITVNAFVESPSTTPVNYRSRLQVSSTPKTTRTLSSITTTTTTKTTLWSDSRKKSSGLEEGMRSKLVTESIAPWRTVRLFLYGALGSGAFVGGLINTSGAIAASNSPDFNLQTEVSSGRTSIMGEDQPKNGAYTGKWYCN